MLYLLALSIYFLIKTITCQCTQLSDFRHSWNSTTLVKRFCHSNFGIFLLFVFLVLLFWEKLGSPCFNNCCYFDCSLVCCSILVTAGHLVDLLKYNFLDLWRKNQWWYFGPYRIKYSDFQFPNFSRLFSTENYFPLFILFVTLLLAIKTRLIENYWFFSIGLTLCWWQPCFYYVADILVDTLVAFYFWGIVTALIFSLKEALTLVANTGKWLAFSSVRAGCISQAC